MDRDATLVARLKDGDEGALGPLISRHRQSLQYMIYCMVNNLEDAEDLAMETIEEAYFKIDKYVPTYNFSTWLFNIGKNRTIDFIRRKKLNPSGPPPHINFCSPGLTPEQSLIYKQEHERGDKILSKLKKRDREIVEMRCDGCRYEEIANVIGLTPQGARTRFHRARKVIMNKLFQGR